MVGSQKALMEIEPDSVHRHIVLWMVNNPKKSGRKNYTRVLPVVTISSITWENHELHTSNTFPNTDYLALSGHLSGDGKLYSEPNVLHMSWRVPSRICSGRLGPYQWQSFLGAHVTSPHYPEKAEQFLEQYKDVW
jgi:hypothetical protein